MPEFILGVGNIDGAQAFHALDAFTQGYIEALFFTSASDPDDGDLQHATFADLAPETLQRIKADCDAFRASLPRDSHGRTWLDLAYDYAPDPAGYTEEQAGHDFWFTRNGHGVGFWDRGLGAVGDNLANACGWRTPFPEVDVYQGDDDKVYLS